MDDIRARKQECRTVNVPIDACSLMFETGRVANSDIIGHTARGKLVVADYDADGRILGLELVGEGKPCQEPAGLPQVVPTIGSLM